MVTREQYTAAVHRLLRVVNISCGASRAAAQVLLSAYNGDSFQLSIPDLCILDPNNYQAALVVIQGRCQGIAEPHELIPNGSRIFEELCADWAGYHLQNRWKRRCKDCDGHGYFYITEEDYEADRRIRCRTCDETGLIAEVWGKRAKVLENMD